MNLMLKINFYVCVAKFTNKTVKCINSIVNQSYIHKIGIYIVDNSLSLNIKKKTLSFYLHCIKAGCDVRVCVTSTRACQPKRRAKFCLSQEGATV